MKRGILIGGVATIAIIVAAVIFLFSNLDGIIKEAVENPQVQARNMIVKAHHKVIGDFKLAGNPIKMSNYKDETTRGDIPDLDEHREKILKEFNN